MAMDKLAAYEPYLRSILRIIAAYVFSLHGYQKFFGVLGGDKVPWPPLLQVAGVMETFLGALILVGLFTRPAVFLCSGEMAVGYFRTHAPRSFWPVLNGGEPAILLCFIFLWICAAGPGPWSLDWVFFRKSASRLHSLAVM
jgi:putative oxidoreductase